MNGYLTTKEMANQWGVSVRQVQLWCSEEKIDGIIRFGGVWGIPEKAPKPTRTVNMKPGRKPKQEAQ